MLREIIRYLRAGYPPSDEYSVAVTASTGIAGLNIGGSTVHSWACIGLGKESKRELFYRLLQLERKLKPNTQEPESDEDAPRVSTPCRRWCRVKHLIIDESKCANMFLKHRLEGFR